MALKVITIRSVLALKSGETIWDAGHKEAVKGFGVRRQQGARVYVVKYRVLGRQRFVTIGRHGSPWTPDQARREAKRLLGMVAAGIDPQAEKAEARDKAKDTFGKVVGNYLGSAKKRQKPRSYSETERHLRTNWKALHPLPVSGISRRIVANLLLRISIERGPVSAARARAALSAAFNWAMREGLDIPSNPVQGTNRPAEPKSRERVLTDAEIREIWAACQNDDYGHIVKLLLITGQRRDEVGGMRWSELDETRFTWTIPGPRTKNHRDHFLSLPSLAVQILAECHRRGNRDHIFGDGPRRTGDVQRGFSGWSKAKKTLDHRILQARQLINPEAKPFAWRTHDLRRTCATVMADRLSVAPHIVEAVLNHVSGHKAGVAGVYNRARYAEYVHDALSKWATYVQTLVVIQ